MDRGGLGEVGRRRKLKAALDAALVIKVGSKVGSRPYEVWSRPDAFLSLVLMAETRLSISRRSNLLFW